MSQEFKLDSKDKKAFLNDVLFFLAPVGVIYFGQVLAALQTPYNTPDLADFALSNVTLGAILTYIVSQLFNLSRKWVRSSE